MTRIGIECFLSICRHKTISKAAETLFITQSSLSIRLKTLEDELGGKLFFSKKGSREMTLTAVGKDFYKLALQYEALEDKMRNIFKKEPKVFRVSSFNSLGTYLLPEVFELFMEKYPEIHLDLQDMDIDAACLNMQNGLTDIAFTASKAENENFHRIPVFCEPMVLVCGKNISLPDKVAEGDLPADREICVEWSSSFNRWHSKTFPDANPQITLSLMSHLHQFLEAGSSWAIVPESVAVGILRECNLTRVETTFTLPEREISIVSISDNFSATIGRFCDCLAEVLKKHPAIRSLLTDRD